MWNMLSKIAYLSLWFVDNTLLHAWIQIRVKKKKIYSPFLMFLFSDDNQIFKLVHYN